MRVDGQVRELSEEIKLEKNKKHTLEVVVDRLRIRSGIRKRLADSLELALGLSGGLVLVSMLEGTSLPFHRILLVLNVVLAMRNCHRDYFRLIVHTGLVPLVQDWV